MKTHTGTLAAAFRETMPVMVGYLFIGFAFGMLLVQNGHNIVFAFLMSLFVFAGAMQFVAVGFLGGAVPLITVALMTLMMNSRHIFYGLTMFFRFKGISKLKKAYLIFALTDETYALLCAQNVPDHMDRGSFFFYIALLNHFYWVAGSVAGAAASTLLPFDAVGIDFAMTALFIVILIEQLRRTRKSAAVPRLRGSKKRPHIVAAAGAVCAIACLLVFGPDGFILPSMLLVSVILILFRKQLKQTEEQP